MHGPTVKGRALLLVGLWLCPRLVEFELVDGLMLTIANPLKTEKDIRELYYVFFTVFFTNVCDLLKDMLIQ
jgi:hypothetical protein